MTCRFAKTHKYYIGTRSTTTKTQRIFRRCNLTVDVLRNFLRVLFFDEPTSFCSTALRGGRSGGKQQKSTSNLAPSKAESPVEMGSVSAFAKPMANKQEEKPGPPLTSQDIFFLDDIIVRLRHWSDKHRSKEHITVKATEIGRLLKLALVSFLKQKSMVDVHAPLVVCGDIHGQMSDLLRLLEFGGGPPATRYLFLGDYVDRGPHSVEVICLLLAYKVRYENDFFLLRGNHECRCINRVYGFYDECADRYSIPVWHAFQEVFSVIPLCALINHRAFCMHGGLPRNLRSFDDLRRIRRPIEVPDEGVVCDLLWADPKADLAGWAANTERGVSYLFGPDVVAEFCKRFDIDLIIRAHQMVQDGFEIFADYRLVTVFSAPNYAGTYTNSAAMVVIDDDMICRFKQLKPKLKISEKKTSDEEAHALLVDPPTIIAGGPTDHGSAPSCAMKRKVSTRWVRRALVLLNDMFESSGFHTYHPGQPNLPEMWPRTAIGVGEAHLSYRNELLSTPIEVNITINKSPTLSVRFKANIVGHALPLEYIMRNRPELEQPNEQLDELLRDELRSGFLKPIFKAAQSAATGQAESPWGLRSTVNWFTSWLS